MGLFLDGNRYIVTCWFEAFNYNYSFVVYPNDVVKPETKYWNTIKKNMPDIFWTRIENWAVPGVPDCYGCKDGVMFWVELKITKDKKVKLKDSKSKFQFSDYQKSDRDFAFVVDKNFKAQDLIEIISSIDQNLIKSVKIFDVYEGENIPKDKKSIALNVTIQSSEKTLEETDLDKINKLIISTVETKSGAKIRS